MSNGPSSSMENAPLLTDARTPNDLDNDEEAPLNNSGGGGARGPRTREAPRDHANFFPLRHGKFSKLEILLAIVCVVFLILMSIFAGLYARGKMDHTPPPQQPPPIIPKPNDTIQNPCLTPDCVVTAAQIINDMDPTANPCEEFFQYTCGGWIQNHVIPEDKGRYGYFDSLYEDNQKLLKEILENDFESTYKFKPDLPPPSEVIDKQNFYKLQSFYQSCMNESLIKELGGAPLLPILNKILDDFPVDPKYSLLYNFGHLSDVEDQRDVSPNPLNLTNILASLSTFGIRPLFEFYVDADAKDPKNNVLYLSQSGLGLPSKEYYEEEEILSTYKDVMITLLDHALDYDDNVTLPLYNAFNSSHDIYDDLLEFGTEILLYKEWEKNAIKIIDFEKKLARISLSAEEFSDPEATYNNQTIVSLSRLSPSFLWSTYISTMLPSNSDGFPSRVILTSDKYFEELSKLVNETPTSTLQLYFIWQAIYNYADNLSEDFRAPIRKLRAKLRGTDETVRPKRWEECLKSVDNTLGLMAGRYFVLRAFGGQSKEMADQIIFSLKDAFIERLPQLDWLDDETREKAIEKVNRIIQKIGYPVESPDTMSPQSLAEYYEKIDIKEDKYFENLVSAYAWASEKKWKKVGKPVDLGQWYMTPQTVNAYYNPTANEIVFPAGILQSPFFNARAPEYINYGAIGMVVGHELTHAFDNNGRQYDASGKLTQWWSNATIEAFKEKAQCFVYQYGNYTIDGPKGKPVNLNGVLTLGENLADNGGLKESFNAWLARFEENNKNHNNQLLPGLQHLTREQLFYISFGRSWCSRTRPETAVERVRVDPHSPAIWRVNGVLRNSEHFAKTFNCHVGSKMNPVDKCTMW